MELKRFVASDTKTAMEQVRATCGDEALIISTNRIGNKTEMICAVEIAAAEPQESSSASAVVNMLSKAMTQSEDQNAAISGPDTAPAQEGNFSSQLGSALRSSNADITYSQPKPSPEQTNATSEGTASMAEMRTLMQTIQSEFSDLRDTLRHQSDASVSIDKARAAISSFNRLIQKKGEDQFQNVLEQIQALNKLCPGQQRDWQGAHLILGLPGSGKTNCIMQIAENLTQAGQIDVEPNRPTVLITLGISASDSLPEQWPELSRHAQKLNIAYFYAENEQVLAKLLETYRDTHTIFIDSHAYQLNDDEALLEFVGQYKLTPHVCFPADNSLLILENLRQRASWLVSSIILTRLDLVPDFESLISALEVVGAQVDCVTGCTPSTWHQKTER
jgi:flagellar biosynthesis GTPase FlhF